MYRSSGILGKNNLQGYLQQKTGILVLQNFKKKGSVYYYTITTIEGHTRFDRFFLLSFEIYSLKYWFVQLLALQYERDIYKTVGSMCTRLSLCVHFALILQMPSTSAHLPLNEVLGILTANVPIVTL
jgi:hypothetical protein